jgi:hypothetical protein
MRYPREQSKEFSEKARKIADIVTRFVGKTLSGNKAFMALGLTAELVGLRFCWKRIKR